MNGDSDSTGSHTIAFLDSLSFASGGLLTLSAKSGSITAADALTLAASGGMMISDDLTSSGTSGSSAVALSAGGTLTVQTGKTITSNSNTLYLTASDLDLDGEATAGSYGVHLHKSASGTVGLGATAKDMHLDGAELQRMTAAAGLTIGSSFSGTMTVDGIADGNGQHVATLTLLATGASKEVEFVSTDSSFNKGMTVQAAAGITVGMSVTVQGASFFDADTDDNNAGTLTISTGKTLSSSSSANTKLYLTAYDVDLDGSVSMGSSKQFGVHIHGSSSQSLGLGGFSGNMQLDGNELQRISASGLTLGSSGSSTITAFTVHGVTQPNSDYITDYVSIVATADDAKVIFETTGSTFNYLSVRADDGITVAADLSSDNQSSGTVDDIKLDGDSDSSATNDSSNDIHVNPGVTITAGVLLKLDAQSGGIAPAGAATFAAAQGGITLNDDLTGNGGALVFDAAVAAAGELTIASTKSLKSLDADITITATDLDFATSSISAGTAAMTIHGRSGTQQTIGLGATPKNMQISDAELQRITAVYGLTLGNSDNDDVTVNGVTATSAVGTVTLAATRSASKVVFAGSGSTFTGLLVQAAAGWSCQSL
jgi:hypothetical protein